MGHALVMAVLPEESLALEALVERDDEGRETRVRDRYDRETWLRMKRDVSELLRQHPNAYYPLQIAPGAVWAPPREERGAALGTDALARRRHTARVRKSLATFLGEKLAELRGMVRTGWWVLGDARVEVTRLTGRM